MFRRKSPRCVPRILDGDSVERRQGTNSSYPRPLACLRASFFPLSFVVVVVVGSSGFLSRSRVVKEDGDLALLVSLRF